jgi:hypothetical protein
MALRHIFVTLCLNAGISVAKLANIESVKALIKALHPVVTDKPLIRLGGDGDGAYLVPDDFDGIIACFSPGVDDRAPFETALIAAGIPCYLADASVAKAPVVHPDVHFLPKFLGAVDDELTLTLDSWVADSVPPQGDLLLQMDIEGAEWIVLLNTPADVLRRFRIIIMEVHDLERLLDKHAFPIIEAAFKRLMKEFVLVHNHPNNYGEQVRIGGLTIPRVQEMTWLRKDRAAVLGYATQFPHSLDVINDPNSADVVLPPEWHGGPEEIRQHRAHPA